MAIRPEVFEDWQEQANCKGENPDVMFPQDAPSFRAAKILCSQCVVRVACLEYALINKIEHGIWGGASERERRRMIRRRHETSEA